MENDLSMDDYIKNLVRNCNYHLRNIASIRKYLNKDMTKTLVMENIISRVDYCNSLLYGLPNYKLRKIQIVINNAARLINGIKRRERITPHLIGLHWLPLKARLKFKLCCLTYKALKEKCPLYLKEHLVVLNERGLEGSRLHVPSIVSNNGKRAFSYAAPVVFNELPRELRNSASFELFKKDLKTLLFREAYDLVDKTIKPNYKL